MSYGPNDTGTGRGGATAVSAIKPPLRLAKFDVPKGKYADFQPRFGPS